MGEEKRKGTKGAWQKKGTREDGEEIEKNRGMTVLVTCGPGDT